MFDSPVISRVPRPCVRKLNAQRMNTSTRFWKPTRYQRWMPSHKTQAMKPDTRKRGGSSAIARARPSVARLPLSLYLNGPAVPPRSLDLTERAA